MPPPSCSSRDQNGAGKSTLAPFLLRDALAVSEFVNADRIAQGLSAFNAETVAVQAGRLTLTRLDELARQRSTFAFETTRPVARLHRAYELVVTKATPFTWCSSGCPTPKKHSGAWPSEWREAATAFHQMSHSDVMPRASATSSSCTNHWQPPGGSTTPPLPGPRGCSLRGREPPRRRSLTGCFGMSSCDNRRSHDRAA